MSKISIIVPIYNVEKYLNRCIESILNQTFRDFELILVNDGSTDNSLDICRYYEDIDNRICVINKNNGGLSSARNCGIKNAKYEYIGFIDGDDYIHPQMYELLYDAIIKNNSDLSICDYKKVFENESVINKIYSYNESYINTFSNIECLNRLYDKNNKIDFIIACNKLYKKDLFNTVDFPLGKLHEDEFIAHKILYETKKVTFINKKLYYYLQRENSIMGKGINIRTLDVLYALYDRINFFKNNNLMDLYDKAIDMYIYKSFLYYYEVYDINTNCNKALRKVRINIFRSLLNIYTSEKFSIKEVISWIIFCVMPQIYRKIFIKIN